MMFDTIAIIILFISNVAAINLYGRERRKVDSLRSLTRRQSARLARLHRYIDDLGLNK
jgi:hypothetical protein